MEANQIPRQRPYVGAHLLIMKGDDVLLMKRSKGQLKNRFALIAGHVDETETPSMAMIREAKEEIGIQIKPEDLSFLTVLHRPQANYKESKEDIIEFVFVVQKWAGDIKNLEPDLCNELSFFNINDLPPTATSTVTTAVDCLKTKEPYFEISN